MWRVGRLTVYSRIKVSSMIAGTQVTSNIPIAWFLVLGCNRQARVLSSRKRVAWRWVTSNTDSKVNLTSHAQPQDTFSFYRESEAEHEWWLTCGISFSFISSFLFPQGKGKRKEKGKVGRSEVDRSFLSSLSRRKDREREERRTVQPRSHFS